SPVPTSIIQLWIPRVELHLFYNSVVFIPMVIGMYYHMFPPEGEAPSHKCACAVKHESSGTVSASDAVSPRVLRECMRIRRLQHVRMVMCVALTLFAGAFLPGCRKTVEQAPELVIRHEVAPLPPRVGPSTITLNLFDAAGKPIAGARVNLEGNMSHPGM